MTNHTPKQVEDLAAPIKDAFYAARDAGRTMHQAADDAARALLANGWVHHDTLPYINCGCGRTIYLPALDPNTTAAASTIAREVLAELADHVDACSRAHDPGTLIRDWADANYPDDADRTDDWSGGFADNH